MRISVASVRSGLSAKTIRYYEDIGLVHPARKSNGYRDYDENDVHRLRLLQLGRSVGFSIDNCRQLLSLINDRGGANKELEARVRKQLGMIDLKIAELTEFRQLLSQLVANRRGHRRWEDCAISGRTVN